MKKIFLVLLLSGTFSMLAHAEITCLDNFNNNWNDAWNQFGQDKYDCLVDPFAAPFNCEEDALTNRIIREENAVFLFENCCEANPNC